MNRSTRTNPMSTSASESSAPCKIGLVAGWGRYPVVVATALKQSGHHVCCMGIKDHADPALRQIADTYGEFGLARMGAQIRFFKQHNVTKITMAGKIDKIRLVGKLSWIKHVPDLTAMAAFYHHFFSFRRDRRDDTLLSTAVELAAKHNLEAIPATDFAPGLLVQAGRLAGPRLSQMQRRDIDFAWSIAKEIGRLDIGQTVAVNGQAALAIEAIEGTDECIRRAGKLCPSGGFTVVKVSKPQQDMRFDVPTIGMGTLQTLAEAGGRVLAIEAGKTIFIDHQEAINFARRHRISLVAIDRAEMSCLSDAA